MLLHQKATDINAYLTYKRLNVLFLCADSLRRLCRRPSQVAPIGLLLTDGCKDTAFLFELQISGFYLAAFSAPIRGVLKNVPRPIVPSSH